MNLKHNINLTKQIMKTPYIKIKRFQQVYSFSNENLVSALQNFNVRDQECLCVQASSDQVLDLYALGAKSIDTFDINPLTEPYFYLKKAAFCAGFNQNDFLYFFSCHNFCSSALNLNMFHFLRRYLEGDMLRYWDFVFTNYSPKELKHHLFSFEQIHPYVLKQTLNYLDDEKFRWLQKNIAKLSVQFHYSDFLSLFKLLNRKYDFMYFSNIIQYIENMFPTNYNLTTLSDEIRKLNCFKSVIEEYLPFLNDAGIIMAGYLYFLQGNVLQEPIFRENLRNQVFGDHYEYISFRSIYDIQHNFQVPHQDDTCMILKKDSLSSQK